VIAAIAMRGGYWVNQLQTTCASAAGGTQFTHGGDDGVASPTPLTLAAGQFIDSIQGSAGDYVKQLTFAGPTGTWTWPNNPQAASAFAWTAPAGTNLIGFQGHCGSYLDQLQPIVIALEPAGWRAPVIEPPPYSTTLAVAGLGVGFDTFTASALPNSAIVAAPAGLASQGVQRSSAVKVFDSVESLTQDLSQSWGFSIGVGPFKLGYSKAKTKSLTVTDTAVTVLVVARAVTASPVYTGCALSAAAATLDPAVLVAEYGDSFVASTVNGGEYVAVFVYHCETSSEQQTVARSLTAGLQADNEQLGANLGSTLSNAQSAANVACTCHQSLIGSTTAMPVLTGNAQTDITALVEFATGFGVSDCNAPVVLSYTTTGYEALLPPGSAAAAAFAALATNRATYRERVVPALARLAGV
jgi:trimeric autotransporter adhesin